MSGTLVTGDRNMPLSAISVEGGVFMIAFGEGSGFLQYEGVADGDVVTGTVRIGVNGERSIPWSAVRTSGTMTDIDK